MSDSQRRVMLAGGDPLLLEGLKILLQDLRCDVIVARNHQSLQQVLTTVTCQPKLIITPVEFEKSETGEQLINEVRAWYKTTIPAILLTDDHGVDTGPSNQLEMTCLCSNLNPLHLKKIIINILDHAIMPENH